MTVTGPCPVSAPCSCTGSAIGGWVCRPGRLRAPLSGLYRRMHRRVRNKYGIELDFSTRVGRRVHIQHQSAIVISGYCVIGDECIIRHSVTMGIRSLDDMTGADPRPRRRRRRWCRDPRSYHGWRMVLRSAPTRWCCATCRRERSPSASRLGSIEPGRRPGERHERGAEATIARPSRSTSPPTGATSRSPRCSNRSSSLPTLSPTSRQWG